jgi:hypothetical protein
MKRYDDKENKIKKNEEFVKVLKKDERVGNFFV